jgi:NAD+ diphosphatase
MFDKSTKTRELKFDLEELRLNANSKHILVWKGKILFDFSAEIPTLAFLKHDDSFWSEFTLANINFGYFVGYQNQTPIFYHDISDWDDPKAEESKLTSFYDDSRNYHPALHPFHAFCELRSIMTILPKSDAAILASVKGIYEWNKVNNFCSKCGNPTITVLSGWEKVCNSCNSKHFPRTDPVVIMLVYDGDNVLLGRSAAWPKGMFSCLAGFMEPGESIEAAVARETFEETSITVENIRYITSQPWPFPASLMIGCIAKATSKNITVDHDELEDARWFNKNEISEAIKTKGTWWPARKGSIARYLINQWVSNGS